MKTEQEMENRIRGINVDTSETLEECFLKSIKNVIQFGNDAQAIRLLEKYFEAKKQPKQETLEEAFDRFIKEMTVLNPKGGFKIYLKMAVNFGANWQKQKYENKI